MPLGEEVVNDYRFLKLSLKAHPASFLRAELQRRGIIANDDLRCRKSGERLRVSGLVTCRQRPGSAQGVVFMTIEDETALANIIIWPKTFARFRPIVLGARYVAVSGLMQQESGVIHVVADRIEDLTPLLARLAVDGTDIESPAHRDDARYGRSDPHDPREFGGRRPPIEVRFPQMATLASDLDVPARGSAHVPGRRQR
jgi:DNA polymerase III alpha subunit